MKLKLYNSTKTLDPGNVEGSREKKVKLSRFTTFFFVHVDVAGESLRKESFSVLICFTPETKPLLEGVGVDWARVVAAGGGGELAASNLG